MIGLYHFCMEYYKNKMAYLNIILIIKHRFYEKNTKTTAAENAPHNTIRFRQQAQGKE